jgi:hypothetical protein
VDAVAIADGIMSSYRSLWAALTDKETSPPARPGTSPSGCSA